MPLFPLLVQSEGPGELAALTILAIVQGLTEFLPVSSSGHLVVTQALLGGVDEALLVDVALHVGTLFAVLVVYRRAAVAVLADALRGKPGELVLLGVGSIPVVLLGLFAKDAIEAAFHSERTAAFGLFGTAVVLMLGELGRRRSRAAGGGRTELRITDALVIGVAQAVAIIPGVSRSGSTIAAGLLCGLAPDRAARFSFLLSIIAITGAAGLQAKDLLGAEGGGEHPPIGTIVWAMLVAAVVGWGALKFLLSFLDRGAFRWFSLYCAALAVVVLLFVAGAAA